MHTTAFAMNAPTYTGGPCAGLADWLAAMSRHHGHSGERGRRGGFPGRGRSSAALGHGVLPDSAVRVVRGADLGRAAATSERRSWPYSPSSR